MKLTDKCESDVNEHDELSVHKYIQGFVELFPKNNEKRKVIFNFGFMELTDKCESDVNEHDEL